MTVKNNFLNEHSSGTSGDVSPAAAPPSEAALTKKRRAKAVKSSSGKTAASGKKSAKTSGTKATPKARTRRTQPYEPSEADIRLRAYFIAQRRVQLALQGDPANDWLEAKHQLLEEAAGRTD